MNIKKNNNNNNFWKAINCFFAKKCKTTIFNIINS